MASARGSTDIRIVIEVVKGATAHAYRWQRAAQDFVDRLDVGAVGQDVHIEVTSELICEHCGLTWAREEDSAHNGGCCQEDWDVMVLAKAKSAGVRRG